MDDRQPERLMFARWAVVFELSLSMVQSTAGKLAEILNHR
jgi:hypothetical protein